MFSLQEAADYIGKHCNHFADQYLSARKQLPPSLGTDALRFIDALGDWMVEQLCVSSNCQLRTFY